MKHLYSIRLAAFIMLTGLLSGNVFAQDITVKFRVTDDAKNVLKGMQVNLYQENAQIDSMRKAPSQVTFKLEQNSYYTIEVKLKGFVTKRVGIFTDLAEGEELKKDEYRFQIALERSADYENFEGAEHVLDYPSAIIEFDTNSRILNYNEQYYLSTQQAFERLHRANREIKF